MLQRIQSLFLLLAAAAMLTASVTPLATFLYNQDQSVVLEAMGVFLNEQLNDSTWGLFVLGVICSVLPLITVFLYKNRMLQIRISVFNLILMVGFYLYLAFVIYRLVSVEELQFLKIGVGGIMPAIGLILTILAIRRIGADEALVRSLNRLRR